MANVDAKINLNKFYDVARKDIKELISGAAVNAAVIFNDSGKDVKFFVYNYIDTVYWVSAARTLILDGHHGSVVASGKYFKIHPNDNKDEEFLVAPNKAYVYKGPGNLETV